MRYQAAPITDCAASLQRGGILTPGQGIVKPFFCPDNQLLLIYTRRATKAKLTTKHYANTIRLDQPQVSGHPPVGMRK
ncbi:hypothetical protein [Alkalimonas mucilaginosa]|uniref:Uncharacterized protein n=1 Tax=Alkalimonas mucilaginosa TaxID=3057676 RepID=A0ABU7JFX6_9GAMM|nr:hypothetical protein [Alkalimonas sp. MEB004]MEE2024532.1 hypothetical protein [Alkalimonas sp. MEB004]